MQEINYGKSRIVARLQTDIHERLFRILQVLHYCDIIMGAVASQITSLTIVYSSVCSGADQRKHQSSASLAFVWGIHRGSVNSPHKWPVTRKMVPFDDVIMYVLHKITHKNPITSWFDWLVLSRKLCMMYLIALSSLCTARLVDISNIIIMKYHQPMWLLLSKLLLRFCCYCYFIIVITVSNSGYFISTTTHRTQ